MANLMQCGAENTCISQAGADVTVSSLCLARPQTPDFDAATNVWEARELKRRQGLSVAVSVISVTLARALDSGQPRFAASAICWN